MGPFCGLKVASGALLLARPYWKLYSLPGNGGAGPRGPGKPEPHRPAILKGRVVRVQLALELGRRRPSCLGGWGERAGLLARPGLWLSVSLSVSCWEVTFCSKQRFLDPCTERSQGAFPDPFPAGVGGGGWREALRGVRGSTSQAGGGRHALGGLLARAV